MRLNRLDLIRYGMFTDFSIDFGLNSPGRSDLHIIYGPNEAGKSTLFAAYLDLLYSIKSSRYNFLHPDATMRISGALNIGGEIKDFTRIKRPLNSLLDYRDQPIAEAAILSELILANRTWAALRRAYASWYCL